VLQYVATNDDSKAFGVLCDPKHNYGCTTKTTYTPPNTWNHGQPRNINDITTRLPLANGFVKDIPITLPNSTQAPRNFQMTTRATYNPKPYHPQPTEPRRGLEWTEETYKNDWQKTRSSVYNKERHGQDIITSRNQFREGEQEATRHLAAATETTQKFVTPQHPSTKELPNLVPQRAPYDRSGNTGNNSFTMSTHARPVYLTDPRKDSDGKWNVNGNTVSGAAQLARTARTDPMEYLNMTKGPSVTTTGNFHARKATTREVADNQAEVGFVQKVGKKTTSGYGSNNIATAAYLPERQEAYNSTYSTNHSMAFNYSMPQRVKETQNVSPVKDNGFVRGTVLVCDLMLTC
jgi:hypothetical protein